jgi:DNA end-binding protein Ku
MQAIWKGTVSFGLVSIPVKLYSATEERGVSFRQVHEADGGRIRYKRVCSVDGEEVAYRDIAKGYELPDGEMVVLTEEDFSSLPLPSRHTIDVLQFVPADQIDGLYLSKGYYLAAEGAGLKPYVLLRDALERSGRSALVKVALRNRESLAVLRPRDGALLVQTMLWPDELRDAGTFAPGEDVEARDQEVAMAESYIDTLTEDFDPSQFSDNYREALESSSRRRPAGAAIEVEDEPKQAGTVVDLMAALRASVEAAKQKRSGDGAAQSEVGARPAKKAAAKTAAAKAATKSTAKTAGKSTGSSAAKAGGTAKAQRRRPSRRPPKTAKTAKAPAKKAPTKTASAKTAKAASSSRGRKSA